MYRIYLVEDNQVIAATIGEKLTAWGFTVRCAENFSDILGEFASFQPHLVLMDITLPFSPGLPGAHPVFVLSFRQHQYRHGHQHGGGRFHRQAL